MQVAKEELARECDYEIEAVSQKHFREFLSDTPGFHVPRVVDELSSKKILTTELISGKLQTHLTLILHICVGELIIHALFSCRSPH